MAEMKKMVIPEIGVKNRSRVIKNVCIFSKTKNVNKLILYIKLLDRCQWSTVNGHNVIKDTLEAEDDFENMCAFLLGGN